MMNDDNIPLVFFVNGRKITDEKVDPTWSLIDYLRKKLGLCGTKLGCSEGGCGACTVMVSKFDRTNQHIQHFSVNACLAPVCSMHGLAVTTIEGIGDTNKLHPAQERIYKAHGSQCGFCTPGIVMSMYSLLRNKTQPSMDDINTAFQGNLCRCTGYRPILEGYKTFTEQSCCQQNLVNGNSCCRNGCDQLTDINEESSCKLFDATDFLPYDPSQEPIFPPELQLNDGYDKQFVVFKSATVSWYRPVTIQRLLQLKSNFPNAKLVVGNTEIGIETKFKNALYPVIIAINNVPELNTISVTESEQVTFGAAVSLSRIEQTLTEIVHQKPEHESRVMTAVLKMLHQFAGRQIRNVASLGGNINTASPISDMNPLLVACKAKLNIVSQNASRTITIDHNFFTGYRKVAMEPNEIILSISLPFTRQNEYFQGFKQAQRQDDDIAIVTAGMYAKLEPNSSTISQLILAYGGVSATTVIAKSVAEQCIGMKWNEILLEKVCHLLPQDLPLEADAPGGMVTYRNTLTLSFFFKFYHHVGNQLRRSNKIECFNEYEDDESFYSDWPQLPLSSSQVFQEKFAGSDTLNRVGHPVPHHSAALQATGEAIYFDDVPPVQGELFMALVTSTRAHAKLDAVDAGQALAMAGVKAFVGSDDLGDDHNWIGPKDHDERVFARDVVTYCGQMIGAVLATDEKTAREAAKRVRVRYTDLQPLVLTIEDAIERNSFFHAKTQKLCNGNADAALHESDHVIEGELRVGGQEHFYMEPQGCIVTPGEKGQMHVLSSTQNPTSTQFEVAKVLNIPFNHVVCTVKRIGGGFGGKESRNIPLAVATAIAARKTHRPVRCVLQRDEDMAMTGNRHPFLFRYKVGFSNSGMIRALTVTMYANAGDSVDLSPGVLGRCLFHLENAYYIPHFAACGYLCKTNLASNTAFRAFGAPQAMMAAETWIEHVAHVLGRDPAQIREMNLYKENDLTYYNQPLEGCTIRRCWEKCKRNSDFEQRKAHVEQFNRENRWKKKGIAMTPVKFGVAFNIKKLNQAGALVHIYTDGSVLLSHSGVEMGQGLHIKMIQVASKVLGIGIERINVGDTSTDKVPNTSATAASVGSDLNGMAVMKACQVLAKRLQVYKTSNPKGRFEDWVKAAYDDRVSLSATGFYRIPNLDYDPVNNRGRMFSYFSYGAACSQVEVDCLTGTHRVVRTDIVMDVGDSLNPAIDIGQIEGAFVQGYGLFTMEEVKFSPKGFLYTRGPGTYKIPSFADIPRQFNVVLLKNAANPHAVYSSKAIGEPPLFLAASVYFAIKSAIRSARIDHGQSEHFRLDSPATPEKIRMAIGDSLSSKFANDDDKDPTTTPWSIVV